MTRCTAFIDSSALLHNLDILGKLSFGADIIVMVKANAYGHGLKEIASILKDRPGLAFGVATINEAVALRDEQVRQKIYLFDGGASRGAPEQLIRLDVIPVITDIKNAQAFGATIKSLGAARREIHIKIDTGFNRLGIPHEAILSGRCDDFFKSLLGNESIYLGGIATHFSSADLPNDTTDAQNAVFNRCLSHIAALGLQVPKIHMANSAAIIKNKIRLPGFADAMVRPGLAAYGLDPLVMERSDLGFKPVMSIKASILAIKHIAAGDGVGYGQSFIAKGKTTIAIIAMGYGDGLHRNISDRSYFLCRGHRAPVIGKMSMDSCAIDISHILEKLGEGAIRIGDMVTILGNDGQERIGAEDLGRWYGTIPYEALTSLSSRMMRKVI